MAGIIRVSSCLNFRCVGECNKVVELAEAALQDPAAAFARRVRMSCFARNPAEIGRRAHLTLSMRKSTRASSTHSRMNPG